VRKYYTADDLQQIKQFLLRLVEVLDAISADPDTIPGIANARLTLGKDEYPGSEIRWLTFDVVLYLRNEAQAEQIKQAADECFGSDLLGSVFLELYSDYRP